jgi:hypothetical protein
VGVIGASPVFVSADILAALHAAPLGGVRGPTVSDAPAVADRVVLPRSESNLVVGQFRQILLAQTLPGHIFVQGPESPGKENPPLSSGESGVGKMIQQSLGTLADWKRVVDDLFRGNWSEWNLADWLNGLLRAYRRPQSVPDSDPPAGTIGGAEEGEMGAFRPAPDHSPNWTWLAILPGLGLLGSLDASRRRAPQLIVRCPDDDKRDPDGAGVAP